MDYKNKWRGGDDGLPVDGEKIYVRIDKGDIGEVYRYDFNADMFIGLHSEIERCDAFGWMPVAEYEEVNDTGAHYRHEYKGIKLDPARIAQIYAPISPMLFSALKKILKAGERGKKDYKQDVTEARDALNRELEMMGEDEKQ